MTGRSQETERTSLGLGLISIGRPWGHRHGLPPPQDDALDLLEHAVNKGIRFFDTAPAYGASEQILGRFLSGAGHEARRLVISTKFGEHWDSDARSTATDHSYDALRQSLDRSLQLLGRIDVLQLHKASSSVLQSQDVARAIDYARALGIRNIGASVSDLDSARLVCNAGNFSYIQFPYNRISTSLSPVFQMAVQAGVIVLVNRPFAMGKLIPDTSSEAVGAMSAALRFILQNPFQGVILTGTRFKRHLDESVAAFRSAVQSSTAK